MTGSRPDFRQARIIPLRMLRRTAGIDFADECAAFRTGTRTLRPHELALLAPTLLIVGATVTLLLLGWFVLWLAAVGFLFLLNLLDDLMRGMLSQAGSAILRSIDRRVVSFQGR